MQLRSPRKYRAIQDFANVSQAELAQDVRSTGIFNNEAKAVTGAARKILDDFGGEVPHARPAHCAAARSGRTGN